MAATRLERAARHVAEILGPVEDRDDTEFALAELGIEPVEATMLGTSVVEKLASLGAPPEVVGVSAFVNGVVLGVVLADTTDETQEDSDE